MAKCKYETKNGRCGLKGSYAYRRKCYTEDFCRCHEPQTNADRIRAMSDEELEKVVGRNTLCEYIQDNHPKHCEERGVCDGCIVDWLRKPAEEVAPNG